MLMPVQFHKAEKYALDMTVLPEETKTFFLQNFGCSPESLQSVRGLPLPRTGESRI